MKSLCALAAILLSACQMETAACTQVPAVVGTWRYSAVEEAPVHATVSGTLSITSASCDAVVGSMDIVETSAAGGTQRLAGPVTGQVIDARSFQFDAFVESNPWKHLASVTGDSLSGSWVSVSGTQTASGTFGGRRQ